MENKKQKILDEMMSHAEELLENILKYIIHFKNEPLNIDTNVLEKMFTRVDGIKELTRRVDQEF